MKDAVTSKPKKHVNNIKTVGLKIKLHCYKAKDKELHIYRVIWK